MFKNIFLILLFISFNIVFAQEDTVELILFSDRLNEEVSVTSPLKISCIANVSISGTFESDEFVLIKPNSNFNIKIIPTIQTPRDPRVIFADPPVTTVRSKPKGDARFINPNEIVIYPNPVQKHLTFSAKNRLVTSYSVFDITGVQKLKQTITPTNTATISLENLTSGIYFLKLNLDNGQQLSVQFIKN